ncbi:MAG TPA: DUF4097 family beta strand repeat-containing protein [Oleiagrimonas sp.]|nr:DUF4097 family beta strand repeat-containing protein [Oleiagrimonas sp.]
MKIIRSIIFLAAALVALPALADTTPINQTHDLAPKAHLSVSNVAGAVIVQTWNKSQVGMTGSLGFNSKIEVTGDADDLTIKVKGLHEDDSGWFHWSDDNMGATTLKLMVPAGISLDVDTVSASIDAKGLHDGKLDLQTVSGNVRLDATSPQVRIKSVSGEVTLDGTADHLSITTVSGDIHARQAVHDATAQSVSGDIRLGGGPLEEVQMESVSGDLNLNATLAADADANLHSTSGDIEVNLGGTAQATISANTFSGDIRSAYGTVHTPEYGPGSSLDAKVGNGGATITLKTMSGDIGIGHAAKSSGD